MRQRLGVRETSNRGPPCQEGEFADEGTMRSVVEGSRAAAISAAADCDTAHAHPDPYAAFAGSVPYLLLAGNLVAGWQLGRALLVTQTKLIACSGRKVRALRSHRFMDEPVAF